MLFTSNTASHRPIHPAAITPGASGLEQITNVVFIVKENRTFDNYFGTFPGVYGATFGTISTGEVIPLGRTPDRTPRDISHSFQSARTAIDVGAMDRFDLIPGGNVNGDYLAYTQLTASDIPNIVGKNRSTGALLSRLREHVSGEFPLTIPARQRVHFALVWTTDRDLEGVRVNDVVRGLSVSSFVVLDNASGYRIELPTTVESPL